MNLASLPMYDLPELAPATDAWWRALARALRAEGIFDLPEAPARGESFDSLWTRPELLFSQTCGYPLTHRFRDALLYVATPCYAAEGCQGPNYRSALVVRAGDAARGLGDLRGRRCAINSDHSHSGYNVLRAMVAPLAGGGAFFGRVLVSGGHCPSMAMVGEGKADIAAVDCVTLALASRHRPALTAALRVLAWSPPAPALPYVTARGRGEDMRRRLRAALGAALADPAAAEARQALLIRGIEFLPDGAYDAIDAFEAEAVAAGYPALR
jgi:ABC-type phosphate/phosphonate transport system substrate-binding protein